MTPSPPAGDSGPSERWHPINTAPIHTRLLLSDGHYVVIGERREDGLCEDDSARGHSLTQVQWWRPLPELPGVPHSPEPTLSLSPDLVRDPFAIGQLLESVGRDREFAQRCLLNVMLVIKKHFGDDAVRIDSDRLGQFLDEQLAALSPGAAPSLRQQILGLPYIWASDDVSLPLYTYVKVDAVLALLASQETPR